MSEVVAVQSVNSNASLHNYLEYSRYLGVGGTAPPGTTPPPRWVLTLASTGWAYTLSRPPSTLHKDHGSITSSGRYGGSGGGAPIHLGSQGGRDFALKRQVSPQEREQGSAQAAARAQVPPSTGSNLTAADPPAGGKLTAADPLLQPGALLGSQVTWAGKEPITIALTSAVKAQNVPVDEVHQNTTLAGLVSLSAANFRAFCLVDKDHGALLPRVEVFVDGKSLGHLLPTREEDGTVAVLSLLLSAGAPVAVRAGAPVEFVLTPNQTAVKTVCARVEVYAQPTAV